MDQMVHLGGGVLAGRTVVLPPVELADLHGAFRTGGGDVVFKEGTQAFLDHLRVLLGKAYLLGQLDVDGAIDLVEAEADKVLGAHGVGAFLFTGFAVDAVCDPDGADLHRGDADGLVDGHGAPDAHGDTVYIRLKGKNLSEAPFLMETADLAYDFPLYFMIKYSRFLLLLTRIRSAPC